MSLKALIQFEVWAWIGKWNVCHFFLCLCLVSLVDWNRFFSIICEWILTPIVPSVLTSFTGPAGDSYHKNDVCTFRDGVLDLKNLYCIWNFPWRQKRFYFTLMWIVLHIWIAPLCLLVYSCYNLFVFFLMQWLLFPEDHLKSVGQN